MFGSGDFWDKSLLWFLKILKLPSFYWGNFKKFSIMHSGNLSNIALRNMWLLVQTLSVAKNRSIRYLKQLAKFSISKHFPICLLESQLKIGMRQRKNTLDLISWVKQKICGPPAKCSRFGMQAFSSCNQQEDCSLVVA